MKSVLNAKGSRITGESISPLKAIAAGRPRARLTCANQDELEDPTHARDVVRPGTILVFGKGHSQTAFEKGDAPEPSDL